jgi:chaperone required for assembly of F1-ATPase
VDPRAVPVITAEAIEVGGAAQAIVNGEPLSTPAGNPVEGSPALIRIMVEEFVEDEIVDVTRPSQYSFFSTEHDFIAANPERTVNALLELIAHDYLVHPDERLGRRQMQVVAWRPQIDLWQRVAGRDPPLAESAAEPDIHRHDYGSFRSHLSAFTPAQLSVAMHAANLLKSATLGMLLASCEIDSESALTAATATRRLSGGDTDEELEEEQEWEDDCRLVIARLLLYATITAEQSPA